MRIFAFKGIRYAEDLADRGSLAAPPYDQIDDTLAARLRERPLQFAWLTRPLATVLGNPFDSARETHREWLWAGSLQQDPTEALYPYEILLPGGGRRLGLTALVGLEDPSGTIIRPHERTVAKTVDERLRLLRATHVDLEPILLLSDDDGGLDSMLNEDVSSRDCIVEHLDGYGNRHRLYRLADGRRIALYRSLLESCPGLIADGHHRYETALQYAAERSASTGTGTASKLAVVTSLRAPGLTIDPIHRGVPTAVDPSSVADLARGRQPCDAPSGVSLAATVAAARQPAFVVLSAEGEAELWSFDPRTAPVDMPRSSRHLAVGWLHDVVLPRLGLPAEAARDGRVIYRSSAERLVTEIGDGGLAGGFILPPMSPQDFALATAGGAVLPPKSTRFLPKVVSGLVWARVDDEYDGDKPNLLGV